ncbi:MAG TPA: hypothetical protein GXX58_06395 [Gelria sp.]|nr:hypothetical protein [Gelria sp.]
MEQRSVIQSIMSHVNSAKRDIENFPKSGISPKSIAELDLAYNALNDTINHCNTAMQNF